MHPPLPEQQPHPAGQRQPLSGWPQEPPYDPDAPPVQRPPLPPGMGWGMTAAGDVVPTYVHQPGTAPAPEPVRPDRWPARLLAGGASSAAVLGVVGHYGQGLAQAGHAAQMTGVGVGVATAGLGALALIVKGSVGGKAGQQVNVSVNVNATGGSATSSRRRC